MTRQPLGYERRVLLTVLVALIPLVLALLVLSWVGDFDAKTRWTVIALTVVCVFVGTFLTHEHLVFPLRTLSNLLSALREEDFTLRARAVRRDDVLGDVLGEINGLTAVLEDRKIAALEATALLRAVLAEIDSAIFTFDSASRVHFVNRGGEKLLDLPSLRIIGRTGAELGLADLLQENAPETIVRNGRWRVHHSRFREQGVQQDLLVLTDITRALREEETQAWQRLVRVLGHELNNSLAPIKSIAQSVEDLVARDPLPEDWRDDVRRGTRVIGARTDALTRFLKAYSQLARLPSPTKRSVLFGPIARRVAALETRHPVTLSGAENLSLMADEDQIEQLLINLVKNSVEASAESSAAVSIGWTASRSWVEIRVLDEGQGLSGVSNLFVPFFTTKPGGSGIGLVLSRQIAEAHGGSLVLKNRNDHAGCAAIVRLPLR